MSLVNVVTVIPRPRQYKAFQWKGTDFEELPTDFNCQIHGNEKYPRLILDGRRYAPGTWFIKKGNSRWEARSPTAFDLNYQLIVNTIEDSTIDLEADCRAYKEASDSAKALFHHRRQVFQTLPVFKGYREWRSGMVEQNRIPLNFELVSQNIDDNGYIVQTIRKPDGNEYSISIIADFVEFEELNEDTQC